MDLNDELIKLFAESKLKDAYKEFYKKWKFNPILNNSNHLYYSSYDLIQEGEEEGSRKGPSYVIELRYHVPLSQFPNKIETHYKLDDVKKEIRELQINKIL